MRERAGFANMQRCLEGSAEPSARENMKPFTMLAGLFFLVVAAAHAYRIYMHWAVTIGPYDVPTWVSYAGVALPLILAFMLFSEARR